MVEKMIVEIKELERERVVRVYLPKSYGEGEKRYRVIYMHDGQNVFDPKDSSFNMAWEVDKVLESRNEEYIVVAVDNNTLPGKRLDEYSPWVNNWDELVMKYEKLGPKGGEGEAYGEFFAKTLVKFIDENYRTINSRQGRVVAGSSMGGLISLYIGFKYQEVFSAIGAFSTAAWFAEKGLNSFIQNVELKEPMKVYLDIGTNETSDESIKEYPNIYVRGTLEVERILKERGFNSSNLLTVVEEGAIHNEIAWNRRFPLFLDFIR